MVMITKHFSCGSLRFQTQPDFYPPGLVARLVCSTVQYILCTQALQAEGGSKLSKHPAEASAPAAGIYNRHHLT